jgi:hypothetical protein
VSVCTRCGKDHGAWGGVCPKDNGASENSKPANALQTSGRTMFGVPPAPVPGLPKAAPRPGYAPTLLAPAARLPRPGRPALPTAEEARQNPSLVVSLEKVPTPARPAMATPPGNATHPGPGLLDETPGPVRTILGSPTARPTPAPPAAVPPLLLDRDEPAAGPPVDLPDVGPPIDLPAFVTPPLPDVGDGTPTDLPQPGGGSRLAPPEAPAGATDSPSVPPHRRAARTFVERLAADVKSVVDLLAWASTVYFGQAKQLLWLVAFLVIPAVLLDSCLVAGITKRTATIPLAATAVDFSARKAELAARIQESQSRGQLDAQAVAELAALTATETAHLPARSIAVDRGSGWLRERLALLVQGLLIVGLAFPIVSGLLALAFYDKESGAAAPGFADVWPILVARGGLLLATLLPAAVLVALGYALFVVPGLILSVLFLFLPHVVLFEKQGRAAALARGLVLVRGDAIRVVLTFLAFALAAAVIALLAERLLPTGASRASAFLHFLLCDLLTLGLLPIVALVLARLYLEARAPSSATPASLARAARS